ncbi:hypothetical protein BJ684DRAFT_14493 [Piptocephalis cylindrospora]|uniref:Uncharacterized protein n=1 Tax=Piptocephalis cylindrospora TaxID=1907219 RepID=A0A4P9Y7W6_9FUNG|nr:hypothetical protein BJ684DRAFT_14493 [Piptocephalis cylindrospora]|eukprot:RKP15247.1 hypothetical protein BJ684DRAFT_14493 [Piptocephalis cylindrospora]
MRLPSLLLSLLVLACYTLAPDPRVTLEETYKNQMDDLVREMTGADGKGLHTWFDLVDEKELNDLGRSIERFTKHYGKFKKLPLSAPKPEDHRLEPSYWRKKAMKIAERLLISSERVSKLNIVIELCALEDHKGGSYVDKVRCANVISKAMPSLSHAVKRLPILYKYLDKIRAYSSEGKHATLSARDPHPFPRILRVELSNAGKYRDAIIHGEKDLSDALNSRNAPTITELPFKSYDVQQTLMVLLPHYYHHLRLYRVAADLALKCRSKNRQPLDSSTVKFYEKEIESYRILDVLPIFGFKIGYLKSIKQDSVSDLRRLLLDSQEGSPCASASVKRIYSYLTEFLFFLNKTPEGIEHELKRLSKRMKEWIEA